MIEYTFKVVESDEAAKRMVVLYKTPGREDITIFVPLPKTADATAEIVKTYAPIPMWLEKDRQVAHVPSGTNGTLLYENQTPVSPKTPEQLQQSIIYEVQQRLDNFAKTRNYDGILSACTYASSTILKFASEGQYCVDVRDATWAKLYEVLDEVKTGALPMPESFADVEPMLPVLAWPSV